MNKDLLKKQWDTYFDGDLEQGETAKLLVISPKINQETDRNITWVEKKQIRTFDQLVSKMEQYNKMNGECGYALSSAVYTNVDGASPNNTDLKFTKCISLDFDAYIGDERAPVHHMDPEVLQLHKLHLEASVSHRLGKMSISAPRASMSLMTGGGFLLVYKFDSKLNNKDARTVYNNIKEILIPNKNFTLDTFNRAPDVDFIGTDVITPVGYLFDKSAFDITHAERLAGTTNIKYDYVVSEIEAHELPVIKSSQGALGEETKLLKQIISAIKAVDIPVDLKSLNVNEIKKAKIIDNIMISGLGTRSDPNITQVNNIISDPKLVLEKVLGINFSINSIRYSMFCSPLKSETHPSVSLLHETANNKYINIVYDFHSGDKYSVLDYIVKVKRERPDNPIENYTVTQAIIEVQRFVDLGTAAKAVNNIEIKDQSNDLISEVDTENYLYYILANKKNSAIVVDLRSGSKKTYDGLAIMLESVLRNQLKINRLNPTLIKEFKLAFEEHILKVGFEVFTPGKEAYYIENSTLFINGWISSEFYREVQDSLYPTQNLQRTMELIEEKTPYHNIFIHQMVQSGDLEYFLNWLISVANFNVVPTFPVMYKVFGSGKGVFIEHVLMKYFNSEYVNIMDGQRIASNFNSMLGSSSLVVLDELKIDSNSDFNNLKMLTGNNKVTIERKGIDAESQTRQFNIWINSNEDVPIVHPASDRRVSYFLQQHTLLDTLNYVGLDVDGFIEKIEEEAVEFWRILMSSEYDKQASIKSCHNETYARQILQMHPLGQLVTVILEDRWDELALEIASNETKESEYYSKLRIFTEIKEQYLETGVIDILSVNNYIASMNGRTKTTVKKFIETNGLLDKGFEIIQTSDPDNGMKIGIKLDVDKIKRNITTKNILYDLFPEMDK